MRAFPIGTRQIGRASKPNRAQGGNCCSAAARGFARVAARNARSHGVCRQVYPRQRGWRTCWRCGDQHLRRAACRGVQHWLRATDQARQPRTAPLALELGSSELRMSRDTDPLEQRPCRGAERNSSYSGLGRRRRGVRGRHTLCGAGPHCPLGAEPALLWAGTWGYILQPSVRPFTGLNGIAVPGTLRDSLVLLLVVLEQQTELQPT